MTRPLGTASLIALASCLAACASGGGGGDAPAPVLDPATGEAAAPRNLVLEDVSFRSGTQGRAVDEDYDLAMQVLTVQSAENGARTFVANTEAGFGSGQTMRYDRSTNQFSFDIGIGADEAGEGPSVVMNETFGPLLLVRPRDIEDLENGVEAVYLATQPGFYAGIAGVGRFASVAEADDFLTRLRENAEGGNEDAARTLDAIAVATQDLNAGPNYFYEANGVQYYQYKIDDNVVPTRFVANGKWFRENEDGTEDHGHLVFGQRTVASEMPQTGTATYDGTIFGTVNRQNRVHALRGGLDLTTDFSTGRVEMNMEADLAYRTGDGTTRFIDYALFTGSGSIDDASFSGSMEGTVDRAAVQEGISTDLTGRFEGAFFGPTAQEVGGTFEFSGEDAAGVGSFVGSDPTSTGTD